jgi:hypothetical protein
VRLVILVQEDVPAELVQPVILENMERKEIPVQLVCEGQLDARVKLVNAVCEELLAIVVPLVIAGPLVDMVPLVIVVPLVRLAIKA